MYVDEVEGVGLGKIQLKKALKKVKLKTVVKQVGKVAKVAAPIAVGFIPVGGGVASKLLDSKIGKTAVKLSKTKVGSAVMSQAGIELPTQTAIPVKPKKGKTKLLPKKKTFATKTKTIATKAKTIATKPKIVATKSKSIATKGKFPVKLKKKRSPKTLAIGSKGEEVKELQEQLGVKADGDFGPKTQQALEQATGQKSISSEDVVPQSQALEEKPIEDLTPVKPFETEMPFAQESMGTTAGTSPKNNTLLYVGGAVALAGVAFLAMKKK